MLNKQPHWYKIFTTECPVCGRGSTWRERQAGMKPEDPTQRYYYSQIYDHCVEDHG